MRLAPSLARALPPLIVADAIQLSAEIVGEDTTYRLAGLARRRGALQAGLFFVRYSFGVRLRIRMPTCRFTSEACLNPATRHSLFEFGRKTPGLDFGSCYVLLTS